MKPKTGPSAPAAVLTLMFAALSLFICLLMIEDRADVAAPPPTSSGRNPLPPSRRLHPRRPPLLRIRHRPRRNRPFPGRSRSGKSTFL